MPTHAGPLCLVIHPLYEQLQFFDPVLSHQPPSPLHAGVRHVYAKMGTMSSFVYALHSGVLPQHRLLAEVCKTQLAST